MKKYPVYMPLIFEVLVPAETREEALAEAVKLAGETIIADGKYVYHPGQAQPMAPWMDILPPPVEGD